MPAPLLLMLTVLLGAPPQPVQTMIALLEAGSCPSCKLADADLVHSDLRDADLTSADLQRANLSRSRLDGADSAMQIFASAAFKVHHSGAPTCEVHR